MSVRVVTSTGYKLNSKAAPVPPAFITEEQVIRIIRTGQHINDLPINVREAASEAHARTDANNIPQARREAREIMKMIRSN